MNANKQTFYVTTPIYYVTASPHVGTLYSTIIADVAARWQKLHGKKVFFLTGTDEHGQKIEQAAKKAGKLPKEFVDSFIDSYKKMWVNYELDYSHFIRTTDSYHVLAVQELITQLIKQGDIYKSFYKGWYCTPCEAFVAETVDNEKEIPVCQSCKRQTVAMSEESYFFKLSSYQDKLLKFYEQNPDWMAPKERLNEVTSFVKSGLKDLSISRTSLHWGIPFPGDDKHVVYVWIDALSNYLTGIGYLQKKKEQEFRNWWPADMQVLGKDIVRFHAVYWPALLMAMGLELPKRLLVHGWITVDDKKMSKSFGNVMDPQLLLKAYGAEPVRYYLMRQIPVNQDGNFSILDLEQRIGADLADSLGNLLNRMVQLAHQHDITELDAPTKSWNKSSSELHELCLKTVKEYERLMNECLYHQALSHLWIFIAQVNAYFHSQEPWKVAKNDIALFTEIISATAHSLRTIAILLWPIMPKKMEQLLYALGFKILQGEPMIQALLSDPWSHAFVLRQTPVLFEKPEPKIFEHVSSEIEEKKTEQPISFDDFAKIELVVGTIEQCEPVEKSDKLYALKVNFGSLGHRQILAGVKQSFLPVDLIGKQGIFVFNLAPRKIMSFESQGMMLVAEGKDGKLQLATALKAVENGTRLR